METLTGKLSSGLTNPSPEISVYLPQKNPSGIGVVIFPGGGYGKLAPHEGEGYAKAFVEEGIAGFVVRYRLGSAGHLHPAMLEDAFSAIASVRLRASEFGLDPDRIGVMGSSAGGHLAAHALGSWSNYASEVPLRPSFGVLCYPVISSRPPHAHGGSMKNLLGEDPTPESLDAVSCERLVSSETPPCFLWHTLEDAAVPMENSTLYASALRAAGVDFELHVYQRGRHGLGLNAEFKWFNDCVRWIRETVS